MLTAAASQLGQMLVKLCKEERYPIVCVVRREAQAETLRALGAEHVVVTAGGEAKELKEVIAQLGITVAFDAVAGPMTAALLAALPNKSTVYVFGRLSGEPAHCAPLDLIYFEKKVEGFLVAGHAGSWLRKDGLIKMGLRQRACAQRVCPALAEGGWAASTFVDCTPDTMWRLLPVAVQVGGLHRQEAPRAPRRRRRRDVRRVTLHACPRFSALINILRRPRAATAVNKTAFSMTMKTMNGSPPLPYKKYSAPNATASATCTAAQCASCVGDGSMAAATRAATSLVEHERPQATFWRRVRQIRREAVGQAVVEEGVADQHRQLEDSEDD